MKVRINKIKNDDFKFLEGHEFKVLKSFGDWYFLSDEVTISKSCCTVISDIVTKTVSHVQPDPIEEVNKSERIPFDLEKWNTGKYDVVQRNGMCTRILCTDLEWKYPIATYNKDSEQVSFHTKHGMTLNDSSEDDSDLFLIPKTETVWVNIWHTFLDSKLESEIDSKKNKFNSRFVKTIEIKKPIE